jgi:acetyltransferase-like isoleucine patch superfamily enzyme
VVVEAESWPPKRTESRIEAAYPAGASAGGCLRDRCRGVESWSTGAVWSFLDSGSFDILDRFQSVSAPRRLAGCTVDALAEIVAVTHVSRFLLLSRVGVMTFQHASEAVSRTGTFFGYRVRGRFYRRLLGSCGPGLEMNRLATIADRRSRIGTNVWVGPGSYLDLVDIRDEVLIGPHTVVLSGGRHHRTDRPDVPIRRQGNNPLTPTVIGTGAWIGAAAVVMADVGPGAVVGAGAVVTQPVPAGAVVVGNPARLIARRDDVAQVAP